MSHERKQTEKDNFTDKIIELNLSDQVISLLDNNHSWTPLNNEFIAVTNNTSKKTLIFNRESMDKSISFSPRALKLIGLPNGQFAAIVGKYITVWNMNNSPNMIQSIPLPKESKIEIDVTFFDDENFYFYDKNSNRVWNFYRNTNEWKKIDIREPYKVVSIYPTFNNQIVFALKDKPGFGFKLDAYDRTNNHKDKIAYGTSFTWKIYPKNLESPNSHFWLLNESNNKTNHIKLRIQRIIHENDGEVNCITIQKFPNAHNHPFPKWLPDSTLLFVDDKGINLYNPIISSCRLLYPLENNNLSNLMILPNGVILFFNNQTLITLTPANILQSIAEIDKKITELLYDKNFKIPYDVVGIIKEYIYPPEYFTLLPSNFRVPQNLPQTLQTEIKRQHLILESLILHYKNKTSLSSEEKKDLMKFEKYLLIINSLATLLNDREFKSFESVVTRIQKDFPEHTGFQLFETNSPIRDILLKIKKLSPISSSENEQTAASQQTIKKTQTKK